MKIKLNEINPRFRQLADLLLYSERMDIDLSEFKRLLKDNRDQHLAYLWDRFKRSCEISWEDNCKFWFHRLTFLLNLGDKKLSKDIEDHLQKRMFSSFRLKNDIHVQYDIEYSQFLALCKVKCNRKENLLSVKNYLTELPAHMSYDKINEVIASFIPSVFSDFNEYVTLMTQKIMRSARSFDLLLAWEKQGIDFDKKPIVLLAVDLISARTFSEKNIFAFFSILNDPSMRDLIKKEYKSSYRKRLLELVDYCGYSQIEEDHLKNVKNLLDLDPSIADDLACICAEKLFNRSTGHQKANADKLIRLIKTVPQISSKKILAFMSSKNRMNDIKYMLAAFPDLKKLAAFV
jgi:hypothetical protein